MQTRFCSIFNEIRGSCLYVVIFCFYLHFKQLHEEALQNARRQKINLKVQRAVQTACSDLFALRSCILKYPSGINEVRSVVFVRLACLIGPNTKAIPTKISQQRKYSLSKPKLALADFTKTTHAACSQ